MMFSGVYLHSPFSESTVSEGKNRSLLLQFILCELFSAVRSAKNKEPYSKIYRPVSSTFYPLDWSSHMGYLNKINEHTQLLKKAFPNNSDTASIFKHALLNTITLINNHQETARPSQHFEQELHNYFKQLYLLLEPLMIECRKDENFIFFLLKNQKEIEQVSHPKHLYSFLTKLSEEGIDSLCNELCDNFHTRGFVSLIPEVKAYVTHLKCSYDNPK